MKWITVALALCHPVSATAMTVCDVGGLGVELERFSLWSCEGALSHQAAIDCLNDYSEEEFRQRQRAVAAQAQAECLCRALNEVTGGVGGYDTLSGTCTFERP